MEMLCRRLMLSTVLFLAFLLGTFTNGHRAHSWFRTPYEYDYRDDMYSDTYEIPDAESVEVLSCSSDKNDVRATCVPLDLCPQIRYEPNRQYCRFETDKDKDGNFKHSGSYVCCQNVKPEQNNKSSNVPVAEETIHSNEDKNLREDFPKIPPQQLNRVTRRPDVRLTVRDANGNAGNGDCGILENDGKSKLETRIRGNDRQQILGAAIGGISVRSAAQSPWTVAIGEYTNSGSVDWFCGGSLLSQYTVLTAAHCARRRRPQVIRVGEVDLRRNTRSGEGWGEEIRVIDVINHPEYRPPSYYNDLAVLILERAVDLKRQGGARTICLPPQSSDVSYTGETAILTGWGHLSFGGDRSPELQEVKVTIFSNDDCSRSYSVAASATVTKRSYPSGIINSQLCAGDRQGKKDACQGDSGGPLVIKGKDGRHSVVGVVSSGIGCGSKQYPGVYVRVSSYTDWITSKMKM